MPTETKENPCTFQIGRLDFDDNPPKAVWVKDRDAVWVLGNGIESHDPLDRVGGPYRISNYCTETNGGEKFFLAWIVDSWFPPCILVMGDSFEDAYENFIDWLADTGMYCMVVDDEKELAEMQKDDWDGAGVDFSSNGIPVYADSIQMCEVKLLKLEF